MQTSPAPARKPQIGEVGAPDLSGTKAALQSTGAAVPGVPDTLTSLPNLKCAADGEAGPPLCAPWNAGCMPSKTTLSSVIVNRQRMVLAVGFVAEDGHGALGGLGAAHVVEVLDDDVGETRMLLTPALVSLPIDRPCP